MLQAIGFEGVEGEFSGYNLIQAIYHEGLLDGPRDDQGKVRYQYPLRGQHRVTDAYFQKAFTGNSVFNLAPDATVTIENSTFVEVAEGVNLVDSGGTVIVNSNVITPTGGDGIGVVAIQGYFSVPTDSAAPAAPLVTVKITNNTINVDGGHAAVDLTDMQYAILHTPPSLDATVEGNQIVLNKANYGIIGYGLTGLQLRNNTITGSALYEGVQVSFANNAVTTLQPGSKAHLGSYERDVLRRAPQAPAVAPSTEVTPTAAISPTSPTLTPVPITMSGGEKRAQASPQQFAFYDLPAMDRVGVANVAYKDDLTMDLYYPPDFDFGQRLPVVLFVHGVRDMARTLKETGWYVSWGQLAAASGMVGVNYDISDPLENIVDVLHYLRANADTLGIDPQRICLWASSGNPSAAILAMTRQDEAYHAGLRCAVIYYGLVMKLNGQFPQGFSILAVRAGKDYPGFSDHMTELTDWAQEEGVDVTLIDYPEAGHSFDVTLDTPRTREIIGQTLAYLQAKLQVEP